MSEETPLVVNVISQNMYLDKTRVKQGLVIPQHLRVEPLADTLNACGTSLDVVGIQEAYGDSSHHNGKALAEDCGYGPGVWTVHNEKPYPGSPTGRAGEHLGLFGTMIEAAESIELGDNRRALITNIAGVALALIHFRAGGSLRARLARKSQAEELINYLDDSSDAVVLGDFNEPPIKFVSAARDVMRKSGFESVFTLTNQPQPRTFPSEPYRQVYRGVIKVPLDDILIRGERVQAVSAQVLRRSATYPKPIDGQPPVAESDHDGIMATLSIDTQ